MDRAKAVDTDKLGQILGDDCVGLGPDGKTTTKQSFIAAYKSGKCKIESFDFGPMTVKVTGNVAIVQGSNTEKSMSDGKDSSGKWVWTEVFEKHHGKCIAVRQVDVVSGVKFQRARGSTINGWARRFARPFPSHPQPDRYERKPRALFLPQLGPCLQAHPNSNRGD